MSESLLKRASKPNLTDEERKTLLEEVAQRMKKYGMNETLEKVLDKLLDTSLVRKDEASHERNR